MNPELPGVNMYITTCLHGVDLRFTPRCYLCKPWPDDSPVWKVTSPGHVHEGEWCALCVEHGASEARAPLDVERLARAMHGNRWDDGWNPVVIRGGHATLDCDYLDHTEEAAAVAREYAKEPQP